MVEGVRLANVLGVLSGVLVPMFLVNNKCELFSNTHFDINERIDNFIYYLSSEYKVTEEIESYVRIFSCIFCRAAFMKILSIEINYQGSSAQEYWELISKNFYEVKQSL